MKEFFGNFGGRTLFNEDMEALLDLGLSFHHIFDDVNDNFIISGCEINKTSTSSTTTITISEGYVWLDRKIRFVNEQSFQQDTNTLFILPYNTNGKSISYATKGVSGFMDINYGTKVSTSIPTIGNYISCSINSMANNITNKFYDKYVITKGDNDQLVKAKINITKSLYAKKNIINGNTSASIYVDDSGRLSIEVCQNNMLKYRYVLSNGISIYNASGNIIAELKNEAIERIELPNIFTKSVNYKKISTYKPCLNGYDFDKILYPKSTTQWTNLLFDNGDIVDTIVARRINTRIDITGIFPINNEKFSVLSNSKTDFITIQTNIKLPSIIPSPPRGQMCPIRCGNSVSRNIYCYLTIGDGDRKIYIVMYKPDNSQTKMDSLPNPISINWSYYFA